MRPYTVHQLELARENRKTWKWYQPYLNTMVYVVFVVLAPLGIAIANGTVGTWKEYESLNIERQQYAWQRAGAARFSAATNKTETQQDDTLGTVSAGAGGSDPRNRVAWPSWKKCARNSPAFILGCALLLRVLVRRLHGNL